MVAALAVTQPATRMCVVVTCTHRKRRPVPDALRLRGITGVRTSTRMRAWTERLTASSEPVTEAIDLYAGEHWDVARHLTSAPNAGMTVELWISSAGYGLIPSNAPIRPYAATFTAGNADSVPDSADGATAWWDALSDWAGPSPGPRSISDLIIADPKSRVLLALSATYLKACREDLGRAIGRIDRDGQLSIISAGTKSDPQLAPYLLPADARLQTAVGGTRQALNIRTARHLLAAGITDHHEMSEMLTKLLVDQPSIARYERIPATDSEVRDFIRERLETDPSATHTRLLREFRDDDRACEQGRFAALFRTETRMRP